MVEVEINFRRSSISIRVGWLTQTDSNAGQTTGPLVGINFPQFCHERNRIIANGFPDALMMARAALLYMEELDDQGSPDPRAAGQDSTYRYLDSLLRPR